MLKYILLKIICTSNAQDQACQYSSTDWEDVHEAAPIAKELLAVGGCWGKGDFSLERQCWSIVHALVGGSTHVYI